MAPKSQVVAAARQRGGQGIAVYVHRYRPAPPRLTSVTFLPISRTRSPSCDVTRRPCPTSTANRPMRSVEPHSPARQTGLSSPILQQLAENVAAPVHNPPEPIDPLPPVETPPAPAENPTPQVETPPAVDSDGPHFPGHLPVDNPVDGIPAIPLVEVVGIVLVEDISSLLLSLFGI